MPGLALSSDGDSGASVLDKAPGDTKWDAKWDARLDKLKEYKAGHGGCNVPQSQGLGSWVSRQRTAYSEGRISRERIERLNEIGFEWNPRETMPSWNERYEQLRDFKESHGDCNVNTVTGGQLGNWVRKQRQSYRDGRLSQERIERLESIGFSWYPKKDDWARLYNDLVDYQKKHGGCNVPQSNARLGNWIVTQRAAYKKGQISLRRIQALENIGFSWDPLDALWLRRFDELEHYKNEHGDCNVPKNQGQLGTWVNWQRHTCREGKLSDERVQRLNELGFEWNPRGTPTAWNERYEQLKEFRSKHGDCNVNIETGGQLGIWVNNQRKSYREGQLPQERIERLESIGFVWELQDEMWLLQFDKLEQYKNEHGDCNVPQSHSTLGNWASNQRQDYKKGKLPKERIDLLESIGFQWILRKVSSRHSWKLDERWKIKYTELVHYLIEHGDCNVPQKQGSLGQWVSTQRTIHGEGGMPQYRIDYLESVGFAWKIERAGSKVLPVDMNPDLKAIARIIEAEKPLQDEKGATEGLTMRVKVGRALAEALELYVDNLT